MTRISMFGMLDLTKDRPHDLKHSAYEEYDLDYGMRRSETVSKFATVIDNLEVIYWRTYCLTGWLIWQRLGISLSVGT